MSRARGFLQGRAAREKASTSGVASRQGRARWRGCRSARPQRDGAINWTTPRSSQGGCALQPGDRGGAKDDAAVVTHRAEGVLGAEEDTRQIHRDRRVPAALSSVAMVPGTPIPRWRL
jgi:hypothetical protein